MPIIAVGRQLHEARHSAGVDEALEPLVWQPLAPVLVIRAVEPEARNLGRGSIVSVELVEQIRRAPIARPVFRAAATAAREVHAGRQPRKFMVVSLIAVIPPNDAPTTMPCDKLTLGSVLARSSTARTSSAAASKPTA